MFLDILKQIRINHWIKNLILFTPLFFGGELTDVDLLIKVLLAFLAFSFSASAIYIINDFNDLEEDRKHAEKKNRPLASGKIGLNLGIIIFLTMLIGSALLAYLTGSLGLVYIISAYVATNLIYTFYTKHQPIWDLVSLAVIYLLRLEAGSAVSGIELSGWLFLVIFFGALILIIGKRYSELKQEKARKVLDYYTQELLNSLLLISSTVTIASYSVYAITQSNLYVPTIIIFTFIIFRYYFIVITTNQGQKPEKLLLLDPQIFLSIVAFLSYIGGIIYIQ
ncbi:decaprenyl-phosphate phosphoribosyltransferase [Candidatus Dojkabacteria bacterium]|uniref:Decaprenyl-phosphate phosphoribosyltransferase n=1 Tax=Candidatus Dojkabacteria bacterium TaxID=2099670 RepID=A0A955RJ21_9BACT|nr:decaprenyl-phosphate phosphoribosyltransferase [Candidatus Dojkabacteria bacterium]